MALGLTQPLTEMSTRDISWEVNAAGTWGWQPYHHHAPTVLKSGSLSLLEPSGPVQDCNLPIYYISAIFIQHIKSVALLQLDTFGYMFRPLPVHHQAGLMMAGYRPKHVAKCNQM